MLTSAMSSVELIAARRNLVLSSYEAAKADNRIKFLERDPKATEEYIYPNQIKDAKEIVDLFYNNRELRVVSIQKKTKVGADGIMIEVAKLLTTHSDYDFIISPDDIRIITGMSNIAWEQDLISKAPSCFRDNIFHHGKLFTKADLSRVRNGLIIIDEIDTGSKANQRLHSTLKEAGILNIHNLQLNNNRIILISATILKELYDLYQWGNLHKSYTMTIPSCYIGHKDFLKKGIIKEFYSLETKESVEKWIQEDIINNYGNDYRVHMVRLSPKTLSIIQDGCIRKNILFKNNWATDHLSKEDIKELFQDPLTQHIVVGLKNFYRRANIIPNDWKLRIGATHERYTKKVDYSVQVQGLPGRMTGYWRSIIEGGHKTGPYRTSIQAIQEYEKTYENPFGLNSYQSAGFSKKDGKITTKNTLLSPKNIENLAAIPLPEAHPKESMPIIIIDITDEQRSMFDNRKAVIEILRSNVADYDMKYGDFISRMWRMDTPLKYDKWCLNSLLKPNAYSTLTNIPSEDKDKNILMVYLYENKLILSGWHGAA